MSSPDFGYDSDDDHTKSDDKAHRQDTPEPCSTDSDSGVEREDSGSEAETSARDPWAKIRRLYDNDELDSREARQRAVALLRDELHVRATPDGELYRYHPPTGTYRADGDEFTRRGLERELGALVQRSEAGKVIYKLKYQPPVERDEFGPAGLVCVQNGVLDVTDPENPKLEPHKPGHYFLRQRPVGYDPDARCPRFEQFVEEVVTEEHVAKLQEFVGYSVVHHWGLPFQRALLLLGPTDSGKSTFLNTIESLLGNENVSNLSVQQLANNRFASAELDGKLANIQNDLDDNIVRNLGRFKQFTGDDTVTVEKKNQDPYSFHPTQKQLYAANRVPDVEDAGEAFYNRWLLVEFPDTVPEDEQDKNLDGILEQELPGILNWALDGYRRLMANGSFTNEMSKQEKRTFWQANGNPVEQFIEIGPVELQPGVESPEQEVYGVFENWCEQRGLHVEEKGTFTERLKNQFPVEQCRPGPRGDRTRCYRGIRLQSDTDQVESE